jgi:hypothetical protein
LARHPLLPRSIDAFSRQRQGSANEREVVGARTGRKTLAHLDNAGNLLTIPCRVMARQPVNVIAEVR